MRSWFQLPELVDAFDRAGGVVVEVVDDRDDRLAGQDALGDRRASRSSMR